MLTGRELIRRIKIEGENVERKLKEISGLQRNPALHSEVNRPCRSGNARVWLTFPLPGSPLAVLFWGLINASFPPPLSDYCSPCRGSDDMLNPITTET